MPPYLAMWEYHTAYVGALAVPICSLPASLTFSWPLLLHKSFCLSAQAGWTITGAVSDRERHQLLLMDMHGIQGFVENQISVFWWRQLHNLVWVTVSNKANEDHKDNLKQIACKSLNCCWIKTSVYVSLLHAFCAVTELSILCRAVGIYRANVADCSTANSVSGGAIIGGNWAALCCPKALQLNCLNGYCSTVLLKPVSMVLNTEPLVHIATINSAHISISADEKIKVEGIIVFSLLCFATSSLDGCVVH